MQRLAPAQVHNQRQHLVDQEMTDRLAAGVVGGIAADHLAAGAIDDKVGEIGEGEYVAVGSLAASQPNLAAREPRMPVPSGLEADAPRTPGKIHAHRRTGR